MIAATRHTTRAAIMAVAIILAALVVVGVSVAAHRAPAAMSPRTCFPADRWGPAPDAVRPCVRILRISEDGSFAFSVGDADGIVRYTSSVGALDR